MKAQARVILFGLLALLIAAFIALIFTSTWVHPSLQSNPNKAAAAGGSTLVDQQPLQVAQKLAPLAVTSEEQEYAQEALRLADHEVDLAFAAALETAEQHPAPLTRQARELQTRVKEAQAHTDTEQAEVTRLTRLVARATGERKDDLQQQLKLGQAQLDLDQDELEDAKRDLVRSGGDAHSIIQRMLDEHEESMQHFTAANLARAPSAAAKQSPEETKSHSLIAQFRARNSLHSKLKQLMEAQQEAKADAARLTEGHQSLERQVQQEESQNQVLTPRAVGVAGAGQAAASGANAAVFWILVVLSLVMIADPLMQGAFSRLSPQHRRLRTLRSVARFGTQAVGAAAILLLVFGPPNQLATVIALAGAGLTVALKDFIVGFFGWFVLMGRNGIRPGDWVEINGIGGEVVEVGLLHTVLLETGNWSDAGHPTGRKVTFVNSFAIEGHYFNFSTAGQWMWDELQILLPAGTDPYPVAEAIQKIVAKETEANVRLAEEEWRRAVPGYNLQSFSAEPAMSVRPSNLGINVIVRYITRAHERHEVRSRLYRSVVELLHRRKIVPTPSRLTPQSVADPD